MKLVEAVGGAFEVRWTWLPFWLATNPKLKTVLEVEMKTLVALNGVTDSEEDLLAMHRHVARRLQELFPEFTGLQAYLESLETVNRA
jgi:flagellar biosynthesis/type III secretory pathway chaperone